MWISNRDFLHLNTRIKHLEYRIQELAIQREWDLRQFKKLMDYLEIEQAHQPPAAPDVFVKKNAN